MKRKTLLVLFVLTLLSSVLFAQSVLGASYYLVNGQKIVDTLSIGTYKDCISIINGKLNIANTGTKKVYYVYPTADQNKGYIKVFVNRLLKGNPSIGQPQQPGQPEEPQQPPTQPKPDPQQPQQPPTQPKPDPQQPQQPPTQPKPDPQQPQQPEQPGAYQLTADEQKLVNLINSERTKAGLKPLAIDYNLSKVARIKSEDMRKNNYFSHTSPTYGSPFQMMKDFGITYRSAAENIARTSSVERAHSGFMNSEGHRKNILTPGFTHIGVGISGDYYTEMFISK